MGFTIVQPPGDGGTDYGPQGVYAQQLADSMQLGDSHELFLSRLALIVEAMTISDTIQQVLTIAVEVSDNFTISDSNELTAQLFAELVDSVDVFSLLKTESELVQGWVMNTEGAQPISEYSNFEFNSLAYYRGELYGTSDEGLYKMGAGDDAGVNITAEISSLMLDMGSSRMKRIRSAYLGYTASNQLVLKVRAVSGGQLFEHWYQARPVDVADAPREGYVRVGQGLRSRYWQFELTNIDGGDFEVDQLELYPLFLNRRV